MSPSAAPSVADAPVEQPDGGSEPASGGAEGPDLSRLAAGLLVALVAVAFLLVVQPDLSAPFGDSYEGRNGGVWGAGSRAIVEDGPLESALGARHDSGLVYARHPPLIYPLTATAEWIAGPRPEIIRAPSVLAALATIALLYSLLRTVGLRRVSAVAGVAVASSTSMFTVYGPMPDTPMLGLPVGLALVLAWVRRRNGDPWPRGVEFALAAAAALTAWQAVFVALLLGAVEAVRTEPVSAGPRPVERLRAAGSWLAGTVVGLSLTLAWVVWASGGPGHLVDALTERSGAEGGVDPGGTISAQLTALVDLLGITVLGLVAALVALRSPRWRAAAAILLTAVFGYALLTPDAAAVHDYWLYWAVAPIALGWAITADTAVDARRRQAGDDFGLIGVGAITVVLMVLGWSSTSTAEQAIRAGAPAGTLVASAELPEDQAVLPTVGGIGQYAAWIPLATGVDTEGLTDPADLDALADRDPDHLVLAATWCPPTDDGLCAAITGGSGSRTDHGYVLLTAADARSRVATG